MVETRRSSRLRAQAATSPTTTPTTTPTKRASPVKPSPTKRSPAKKSPKSKSPATKSPTHKSPTRKSPAKQASASQKDPSEAQESGGNGPRAVEEQAQEIPVLDDGDETEEEELRADKQAAKASTPAATSATAVDLTASEDDTDAQPAVDDAGSQKGQQEKQTEVVELVSSATESENEGETQPEEKAAQPEKEQQEEKAVPEVEAKPAQQEEEEEEIIMMDDGSEVEEEEEEEHMTQAKKDEDADEDANENEDEDEDVEQYALLAASGLNLSSRAKFSVSLSSRAAAVGAATVPATPDAALSATSLLKRRLVPNQLDSGASQYKEFFDFRHGNRAEGLELRSEARSAEEAGVLAREHAKTTRSAAQRVAASNKKSAGGKWFGFESEELTADARRDFALLRMRNYLDPKKFYKSSDHARGLPKHFQMGTVIEGAHEFRSARMTKKERQQTFTDEVMADANVQQYTKRVFTQVQMSRKNPGRKKRRTN